MEINGQKLLFECGLFQGCREGVVGAQIKSDQNPVNIFGEPHEVRARVASIDVCSGHADADKKERRRYVESLTDDIKKISVIDGGKNRSALRLLKRCER